MRVQILAGGYLNISTAGLYGPDTLDWELTRWRTLFLSPELIAQDLGLMSFFLAARTVDKHHSRQRWTITVILLTSTGKSHTSTIKGRYLLRFPFCPTIRRYIGLLSFLYPPSFQRAFVLLRSHLTDTIPSGCLLSCTICI